MKNTPANLLPESMSNGELFDFEIVYRDIHFHVQLHTVNCKSLPNALKSFGKAVPRHGKILKARKV